MQCSLSPDASPDLVEVLSWDGVVPLAQVLTHVRPAYGGDTWAEALAYLHATPSEANVIAALAASGPTGFDSPIRVHRDLPDFDDPEDVADFVPDSLGREWVLGNGMHRIACAVLLEHTTIDCTASDGTLVDDAQTEYVEVEFRLPGDWPEDHGADEWVADELDWVCGWLRSFPLPDGTWVESDGLGSCGRVLSGMWTCPTTHADALLVEMVHRYRRYGPPGSGDLEVVKVRTLTGAEWDAEFETGVGAHA